MRDGFVKNNLSPNGYADTRATYYTHWLNAMESTVLAKQLGIADQIRDLEHACENTAARTSHGQPIALEI